MKFKLNVPNYITLIRVALIPFFAFILLANIPHKELLAAFVFILLSVSDILDGYFARKKKQVTDFGKLIDPIADKLLISTALISLIGKGVDFRMAIIIITREFIITAIRIYLLPTKIVVPASHFGKVKTVMQSIAIVFAILNLTFKSYVMFIAVFLTVFSGLEYLARIRSMTGNKIVNLPNLITLCRFLLIIPFVSYIFNDKVHIALLIFAIITLSDKLDGISARLMNQKTELGSGLDSFTDWTLIITTFMLFMIKGYITAFWVILLVIPVMISGLMKMIYARKVKTVPVTFVARLDVGLTYVTIISILIGFVYSNYLLISTIVLAYFSMTIYLIKLFSVSNKPLDSD